MAYKKYDTYKKAEEAVKKLGGSDKYFILKPELDGPYLVAPRKDFTPDKKANGGMVRGTGAAIKGKGFKGVF